MNFKIISIKSYKMSSPTEYLEVKPENKSTDVIEEKLDQTEINRGSLAILVSLGSTKEYLGEDLNLGDIKKLKEADVLKYYNRYQSVLVKQLHKGLIEGFIRTAVKGLSYFLNFDDTKELSKDLQNDELVKRELSLISGQLVLRGGRFVALGSGLFHIIKHINFSTKEPKSDIENYQGVDEHTPPPILREENFKRC